MKNLLSRSSEGYFGELWVLEERRHRIHSGTTCCERCCYFCQYYDLGVTGCPLYGGRMRLSSSPPRLSWQFSELVAMKVWRLHGQNFRSSLKCFLWKCPRMCIKQNMWGFWQHPHSTNSCVIVSVAPQWENLHATFCVHKAKGASPTNLTIDDTHHLKSKRRKLQGAAEQRTLSSVLVRI